MTSLRDRAKAIKEAGAEERGNFQPEAGSVPVRLYQYWLTRTDDPPAGKENFCHYWRVVVFWAPLAWVRAWFASTLDNKVGYTLGVVLYAAVMIGVGRLVGLEMVGFILVAVPWAIAGMFVGCELYERKASSPWLTFGAIITLPFSLISYLGFAFAEWIQDVWRESWSTVVRIAALIALGVFVVCFAGFGVYVWYDSEGVGNMLIDALVVVGFCIVFIALGIGGAYLWESFVIERRKKAKAKKLTTVEKMINDGIEPPVYTSNKIVAALSKFFAGVGDFVLFVGQIVRVKKWKICPLVEIPETKQDTVV